MATKRRVVVTGFGVVSPFGIGSDTYWQGLLSGQSRVKPVEAFAQLGYRSALGAQVPEEAVAKTSLRSKDRATGFVATAVEEALSMAGLPSVFASADRVGCVLGSLCAGIDSLIDVADAYHNGRPLRADLVPAMAQVNHQLQMLSQRHNLTGPTSMVSTACASTTDAIGYGADLIRDRECDIAVVGGGDTLAELIHAGFNSLFSITGDRPRPFDVARDGFAIGEGGAALVIETLEHALARGAKPLVEVKGYGLSNTAYHLTATSVDGCGEALAVLRAIRDAELAPADIDYVNTHGTGTRHNDQSEMLAMQQVFGSQAGGVLANSNKPQIGHCMGAAGALEAIATVMALLHQTVPPTAFTSGNEPARGFDLVMDAPRSARITNAVSQSFGFGGACSCVVLGTVDTEGGR